MKKPLLTNPDLLVRMDRPGVLVISPKYNNYATNRCYSYSWEFVHSPSGKIARWTMVFHVDHSYVENPIGVMEEALNVLSGAGKYKMVIY